MHEGPDPLGFVKHLRRGSKLIEDGELDEAEVELNRAIGLRPGYPQIFYHLGKLAMKREQWSRAISCFHKALALNPDLVEAHFHLARVYERTGDMQDAMDEYQEAVSLQVPGKSDMAERNLERVLRTPEVRKAKARAETVSVRFDTPLNMGDFAVLSAIAVVCVLLSHFGFALLRELHLLGAVAGCRISVSPRVGADLVALVAYGLILFSVMQYVTVLLRGDLTWLGWRSKKPMDNLLHGFAVFFAVVLVAGAVAVLYQSVSYAANQALGEGGPPRAIRLVADAVAWETRKFLDFPPSFLTYAVMVFLAPFAEEFLFRGVLYSVLRKHIDVIPAVAASSALFAVVHFYFFGSAVAFFIGVGSALVYEKRMSLIPAVAFHAFCNLFILGLFQILV